MRTTRSVGSHQLIAAAVQKVSRTVAPGASSASAIAQRLPVYSDSLAVLFQTLPYLLTLIAVAGVIRRPRPPAAVGIPYIRS